MHGFDENANYEPRNTISHEEVALSDESSDEDAIPPVAAHATISTSCTSALDVPLAPSPQPGPSGLGRAVSATLSDDGQSYSVRLQANSSGTTSVTPSGTPSDEEDVAVVQVVRPASPEIITLSDSGEEEEKEESPEVTPAPASSSSSSSSSSARGKALKRRLIASNAASKHRSRKDKSLKKVHKKRPRSSRTSRDVESDCDAGAGSVRPQRYWDLDPEDIRRLRKETRISSKSRPSKKARTS